MPKLRRLNGKEVIDILTRLGYELVRIRGSHHRLKLGSSYVTVPVHGSKALPTGTLKAIYRKANESIQKEVLDPYFYE